MCRDALLTIIVNDTFVVFSSPFFFRIIIIMKNLQMNEN